MATTPQLSQAPDVAVGKKIYKEERLKGTGGGGEWRRLRIAIWQRKLILILAREREKIGKKNETVLGKE